MTRDDPDSDFWGGKNVLVTGASGFAGSNLCRLLSSLGVKLRCFVRSSHDFPIETLRANTVTGDVLDYQSLLDALKGIDVAFHLASVTLIPETRAKIFHTFNTNALGTLNFLMAAKAREVPKIVHVSTCHLYGKQDDFPIAEDRIPKPLDIYSSSKLAGESLALTFAEMFGMNISVSRAFNHFGPYQRPGFLIPSIILRLLKGEKLAMGNPNATRDFSYVDDIVRGYVLLAELGKTSEVYHFSSGIERPVPDIAEAVMKISGVRPEVSWNPEARRVDVLRSVGDSSKARKELGWKPRVDFEDGVKRTVAWYRSQLESKSHETIHVPNA